MKKYSNMTHYMKHIVRTFILAVALVATGATEAWGQAPVEITTADDITNNTKKLYLIQTNAFQSFYIAPQSNNKITTNNILGDYMLWYFLDAGSVDDVQYYYIVNNSTGKYVYNLNGRSIDLITSTDFANLSNTYKEKCKFKFVVDNNDNTTGYYNIDVKASQTYYGLNKQQGSQTNDNPIRLTDDNFIHDTNSKWKFIRYNGTFTWPAPPFTLPTDLDKHYYRIHNVQNNTYYVSTDATPDKVTYASTSSNSMVWYFKEAASDAWNKYYYIVNPEAGDKYMYYSGTATNGSDQSSAVSVKTYDSANEDRYQFMVIQTARGDGKGRVECYAIIPKLLRETYWASNSIGPKGTITDGLNMGIINSRSANNTAQWQFEEIQQVAKPVIRYDATQNAIVITTATEGATIRYTTADDENSLAEPTSTTGTTCSPGELLRDGVSNKYIKAIAVKEGLIASEVSDLFSPVTLQCAKPSLKKNGDGTYTFSCAYPTSGVTIYYTTDGSNPTTASTGCASGTTLSFTEGTTIKFMAVATNFDNSVVATKTIIAGFPSGAGDGTEGDPYQISSADLFDLFADQVNNGDGNHYYTVTADLDLTGSAEIEEEFSGHFDGGYFKLSGIEHTLFNIVNSGTVKNVMLSGVGISSDAAAVGAIANVAKGYSRIYNCGVLDGSLTGTGAVGGLVGLIANDGTRVVNCYNYATINGGSHAAGIVGRNDGTVGATRIACCMMYGDIKSGTVISPVYTGNHVDNVQKLTEYNFYLYSTETNPTTNQRIEKIPYTLYNDQLAIDKAEYLTRFPFYRHILNTHREMAAYFLFDDYASNHVSEIGHWVHKDASADDPLYPIIEPWATNTTKVLSRTIPATTTTTADRDYAGKKLTDRGTNGLLSVSISIGSNSYSRNLPITDMDTLRYDYTYGKVMLPFANEFETNTDYTKVCTGWKITAITGGTAGSLTNYNFADRDCTAKDIYNASTNPFIYAQGGYFIVPYGVTAISIEANFAKAYYLSDATYEVGYDASYKNPTPLGGSGAPSFHGQTIYHDITDALAAMAGDNSTGEAKDPHKRAVVLVGNYHFPTITPTGVNDNPLANYTGKAFTLMSIDADNNQEPDYAWYSNNSLNRPAIAPVRFDFVAQIPLGMSSRVTGGKGYPGIPIWRPRGWFEMTETSLSLMHQFELNSHSFSGDANTFHRCIINGGYFTQMVRARDNSGCDKVQFYKIGGNAYIKEFYPGSHSNSNFTVTLVPINVTGGEIEQCFMTGFGKGKAKGDNIYFWCAGGKIHKFLGAYMEPLQPATTNGKVNLTAKIDHALIGRFFGGGTSATANITGTIDVTINNSRVDFYCGGPEFSSSTVKPVVITHAKNTIFDKYYGAGFGGTSITYYGDKDDGNVPFDDPTKAYPDYFTTYYLGNTGRLKNRSGYGIGTCYKFEYIYHSYDQCGVARFYTGYAQFSLATTGNVTNNLDSCIIKHDFYGAGCQGQVDGTVTSTLKDCTVTGSAFGGGFKAESNEVDVYPTTRPTLSVFTKETGLFSKFGTVAPETYTWAQRPDGVTADYSGTTLYTDVNMSDLGNVTGAISLTVDGGYVGGTNLGRSTAGGSVYGGGNESKSLNNTAVEIKGATTVVYDNVYGGGNQADVGGSVTVTMNSGTVMKDVYGGGALANTNISNVTAGYGTNYETIPSTSTYTTTVNLLGGTIHGDAYGGGLGQKTGFNGKTSDIAAKVYGDITVNLGSSGGTSATAFHITHYTGDHAYVVKSGRVFGCNNLNGSPQGSVKVDVWKTVAGNVTRTAEDPENSGIANKTDNVTHNYEVAAVYGGGNLAGYTATGQKTNVIIETCDVSVEYVYGGGNAAPVPQTDVLVKGAYEIKELFGGGNGRDEYTTDGGTTWGANPGANVNGNTNTLLKGGYVHEAYGGSNRKGTITGNVTIDTSTGGECALDVGKIVGAGKDADVNGDLIMVMGCKPGAKVPVLYAGADNANVSGNVELTITSGNFGKVFGGNNQGGAILGHIKLNIEETGDCETPITIDELYLGGNEAAYSVYGYYDDAGTLKPRTSATDAHTAVTYRDTDATHTFPYAQPELNIISCTYIGQVFGGGYGTGATMYANPTVNVNMIPGTFANNNTVGVPAVMTAKGLNAADNPNKLGIIGDVYGGGNAADVIGNTTVNICTAQTVTMTSVDDDDSTQDVDEKHPQVVGAFITGMVFGGGNAADIEGNCTVNMAGGYVKDRIYGGGNMGSVGVFTSSTESSVYKYPHAQAHLDDPSLCIGKPVSCAENTGTCTVNVSGGQVGPTGMSMTGTGVDGIDAPDDYGYVFGAGRGGNISPAEDPDIAFRSYVDYTTVNISGTAFITGGVYGGSENGRVLHDTHVTIAGGQIGCGEGKTTAYTDAEWENADPASFTECAHWQFGKATAPAVKYAPYDPYTNDTGDDGHTFYGNVFGGGSGYFPYAEGQWRESAGGVEGNTTVDITGGHILTSVYGGNELTDVLGTCTINMSGGTVGVPRTITDILEHPVTCYVFGAGKGDQRTLFNEKTNVDATQVNITGGTIYGSVFGGGEDGHVKGNTSVTIGSQTTTGEGDEAVTTTSGPVIGTWGTTYVDGNVFGAGRGFGGDALTAGVVQGNVSINILGGTMLGSIYGGGRLASVGTYLVEPTNANYGKLIPEGKDQKGNDVTGLTHGHVTINISGGTIGNNYEYIIPTNADMTAGEWTTWKANQHIPLTEFGTADSDKNRLMHTKGGNVFAGAMGRLYGLDGSTLLPHWPDLGKVRSTTVNISGGTIKSNVYGGGELGTVAEGTTINITGGTIGTEVGGNNMDSYTFGSVFGGGYGSDITTEGGTSVDDGNAGVTPRGNAGLTRGNTTISVSGNDAHIWASIYGGGELALVNGNTTVNVSGGMIGKNVVWGETRPAGTPEGYVRYGGYRMGNVYGGGKGNLDYMEAGLVKGNTTVNISGGNVYHNVYGGGALGSVGTYSREASQEMLVSGGKTTVNITGGTIGINGYDNGMVNGSSRGGEGRPDESHIINGIAWVNESEVNIGTDGEGTTLTAPLIKGSVYGGGENGHNFANTNVNIYSGTIGTTSGDYEHGNVYGAGCGTDTYTYNNIEYSNPMAGIVNGNSNVLIKGGKVEKNVYGAGSMGATGGNASVTVKGGRVAGNVYGGPKGRLDALAEDDNVILADIGGDTEVNIDYADTPTADNEGHTTQLIAGSVFGGGEAGPVKGSVTVNMKKGLVNGDVYGGGALANTNIDNATNYGTTSETVAATNDKTTKVNLTGGIIKGFAYGGGLGRMAAAATASQPAVTEVKAKVYGNVEVALNKNTETNTADGTKKGCVVNKIFGCNNLNGTPLGKVDVNIYATQNIGKETMAAKYAKHSNNAANYAVADNAYDVAAVYGGGNLAAYEPVNAQLDYSNNQAAVDSAFARVVIRGCDLTSICQVYGGGNAASVSGSNVVVYGAYEIGQAFGGGNGKDRITINGTEQDNPGANVGYLAYPNANNDAYDTPENRAAHYGYGSGRAWVTIYGGTVHAVYGGSNTKGNIRREAVATLDGETYTDCDFNVGEAYGGGRSADMDGDARLVMNCIRGLGRAYGGAENADVGDVNLNITNGTYDQVFAGNNRGGRVAGSIVLNIEETGCNPIIIGELYAGGNLAPYSIYGYTEQRDENNNIVCDSVDGKVVWLPLRAGDAGALSGTDVYRSPVINVKSFTAIGNIYGGGYGMPATMIANPTVNVNEVKGRWADYVGVPSNYGDTYPYDANGYKGVTKEIDGDIVTIPSHEKGKIGAIQNVFGGGNQAAVIGDTNVNIGTEETVTFATDNPATTEVNETVTPQTVEGVDIRGNVYGGGNAANVSGNTNVTIGQ